MTKYNLTAVQGVEYNPNEGWEWADIDRAESSPSFDSEKEARGYLDEFIKSLSVCETDIYAIDLCKFEEEEGSALEDPFQFDLEVIETIALIDGSESKGKPEYVLSQYFGQYMIAQNRYRLYCAFGNYTANEYLKRSENPSHKFAPVAVFYTEQEARDYVIDYCPNLESSVIDFDEPKNNDDEED